MSPIIILAPSKTMDFVSVVPSYAHTNRPYFIDEARKVAVAARRLSVPKIMKLMGVSKPIAVSVHTMYEAWDSEAVGRPALWTYVGDVYKGMRAHHLTEQDAEWAQRHLLIASGLYGLLRPYDGIQAYRLEMKAQLKVGRAKDIYTVWGRKLSDFAEAQGGDWLCNLSSDEYGRPITKLVKTMPVVTPVFFDTKPNGVVGTVPIYSKMMRGVMARWMIDHRVENPKQLEQFTGHGYSYDATRSSPEHPAFFRQVMKPLVFG